jgi:hypothetical protein
MSPSRSTTTSPADESRDIDHGRAAVAQRDRGAPQSLAQLGDNVDRTVFVEEAQPDAHRDDDEDDRRVGGLAEHERDRRRRRKQDQERVREL